MKDAIVTFLAAAAVLALVAACAPKPSYWGDLSRNVGDVIERR